MQLTQVLLLAFATLALASPHHSWRHKHYNESSDCSAEEGGSSLAPMQPTGPGTAPGTAPPPPPLATPSTGGSTPPPAQSPAQPPAQSPPAQSPAQSPPAQSPPAQSPPAQSPPAQSPAQAPSSSPAAPVSSPSSTAGSSSAGSGTTLSATFTEYGSGDQNGSPNCNTATAACGWYSNPGYNAAASQNLFGVGPGAGAGPACGLCYKLTALTNPYAGNAALSKAGTSIVVKVNNLCPADGNPLCSQSSLTAQNSLGANVNFDLCKDDGAATALFGPSGVSAAAGTAEQVSCDEWTGSGNLTS